MANKTKRGGVVAPFFQNTGLPNSDEEQRDAVASPSPAPDAKGDTDAKPKRPKSTRIRTTVALEPETLAAMEDLRYAMRKTGKKASMSDVLEEAVAQLFKQRKPNG